MESYQSSQIIAKEFLFIATYIITVIPSLPYLRLEPSLFISCVDARLELRSIVEILLKYEILSCDFVRS